MPEGTPPADAAKMTATKKAAAIAEDYKNDVVIGADTIVVASGKILGKPKDKADAVNMLKMLSGVEHEVITGVCIFCGGAFRNCGKGKRIRRERRKLCRSDGICQPRVYRGDRTRSL